MRELHADILYKCKWLVLMLLHILIFADVVSLGSDSLAHVLLETLPTYIAMRKKPITPTLLSL